MRRAPFVAGATVLGMVGVLTFHSQSATSPLLAAPKTQSHAKGPAKTPASGRTTPSTSVPSSSTTPIAIRSATGPNEQYGYGQLAVRVTVSGAKITDVRVQNLQTASQYSQQLADQVIPMLRSEVLSAQSANINGISGASYTAEAYVTSLQAALNQLHVP